MSKCGVVLLIALFAIFSFLMFGGVLALEERKITAAEWYGISLFHIGFFILFLQLIVRWM